MRAVIRRSGLAILALVALIGLAAQVRDGGAVDRKLRPRDPRATWRILGPGGGGAMFLPTINPLDPENVYLRCDMTGGFVTRNGGQSWSGYQLRSVIQDFEFDPATPNTVYAASTGLYRTTDAGRTWSLIYPAPQNVTAERMVGDHAEHSYLTKDGMPDGEMRKIRVDPAVPGRIFIALGPAYAYDPVTGPRPAGENSRLLVSDNSGGTWRILAEITGRSVFALLPGSWDNQPGEIAAVTESGVSIVDIASGALEFKAVAAGRLVQAEAGKGASGSVIYAIGSATSDSGSLPSGDTVLRSFDRGITWNPIMNGIASEPGSGKTSVFSSLGVSENHGDSAYLSCSSYFGLVNGQGQRQFGTFRTDDAGASWRWVFRGSDGKMIETDYDGGWLMDEYGPGWGEYALSIGVSPSNPDVCYASDFGCTYRTTDGGRSWRQVYAEKAGERVWRSRGLDVTNCYGVMFDPFDPKHVFIPYTDIGAFNSFDGGETWVHATSGIPGSWINTCYWAVFDPDLPGRIWSAWGSSHDLPRQKMMRRSNLDKSPGGVAVSMDGGRSWSQSGTGMAPTSCTHVVLDPRSPKEARTVYACGFGTGVWKSTDGGKKWLKTAEIPWQSRYAWRLALTPGGTLFVLLAHGILNGSPVDGALFKTTDGGASWVRVALPAGVNFPNDLIIDPANPARMYLCLWPRTESGREVSGGLLVTEDGGETWSRLFREDAHVYALAVDPANPSRLFINTFDSAAFRSDDAGKTWTKLKGYNFKWGHRPVLDIRHPGMLYLTTFGGGLYHGPTQGTPANAGELKNVPDQWRWGQ